MSGDKPKLWRPVGSKKVQPGFNQVTKQLTTLTTMDTAPKAVDLSCDTTDDVSPFERIEDPDYGPGNLNLNGPRHDNDSESISNIAAHLTRGEALCRKRPYLPRPFSGSKHVLNNPTNQYSDILFRLTREDSLCCIRRGIRGVLQEGALHKIDSDAIQFTTTDDKRGNNVRLNIFRKVFLRRVAPRCGHTTSIEVECPQPPNCVPMTQNDRFDYWKTGSGRNTLQYGSLVCLITSISTKEEDENHRFSKMLFGTVSGSVNWRQNIRVPIEFSANDTATALQVKYSQENSAYREGVHETVMIQVRGHFFSAVHPLLEFLKSLSISDSPLLECILPAEVCSNSINSVRLSQDPPRYLTRGMQLDFSFLNMEKKASPIKLTIGSPARFGADLYCLLAQRPPNSLILDDTQRTAFVAALSQSVPLIQGPPGTGKTYVGVQVVRSLLQNQKQLSVLPIICVCYTNHAVDQFLEALLDAGIPAKRIVRIGGRSASEKLESITLGVLKKKIRRSDYYKSVYGDMKWLEDRVYKIEDVHSYRSPFKNLKLSSIIWSHIVSVYPNLAKSFERMDGDWVINTKGPREALLKWVNCGKVGEKRESEGRENESSEISKVLTGVTNPFEASSSVRRVIWKHLMAEVMKIDKRKVEELLEKHSTCSARVQEMRQQDILDILEEAWVIGLTTSGCIMNRKLLSAFQPKIILCEEAGEVLESHTIAAITKSCQQLILIGDHQQLRPKVEEYRLTEPSGNGYKFDVSLFERLVQERRSFPFPGSSLATLATQRRMHPHISDLIRKTLYPNLIDNPSVLAYPLVRGMDMKTNRVLFFDHDVPENCKIDQTGNGIFCDSVKSYFNEFEANMVLSLVQYIVRQGYPPNEIAVLTPYGGQLKLLQELLAEANMSLVLSEEDRIELEAAGGKIAAGTAVIGNERVSDDMDDSQRMTVPVDVTLRSRVRLATVDNFQGEEAEIVIISTVRSNANGTTGFLKISNRVNVMLSRAKHGMIVLGSSATVRRGPTDTLFARVLDLLDQRGAIVKALPLKCLNHSKMNYISDISKLTVLAKDGGCRKECLFRRPCGHRCPRLCHPDDRQHEADCDVPFIVEVPLCRHSMQVTCAVKNSGSLPNCRVPLNVELICGHRCNVPCYRTFHSETLWTLCLETCECLCNCGEQCSIQCVGQERVEKTVRKQGSRKVPKRVIVEPIVKPQPTRHKLHRCCSC